MMQIIKDWLTARNGVDFSLTKLFAIAAVVAMIFNFTYHGSMDFQGLGIAVAGIIATLAAKYHVEGK